MKVLLTVSEGAHPVEIYPVGTYPVDQSTGYLSSNQLKMVKKTTGFEPV
jgi:hypothetical protein